MPTVNQQDRAALDQFALVLRIHQPRSGPSADGAAGLRLRAHALVKDILLSRLEIEAQVGPQEYVHAQGFTDLGKALAASRALQLAFEGFRGAVPSGRANVSVVLDSFGADPAGPSVEQKDLLDSAKPSQVLITQAFYKKIAHCQPVGLRSFPPRAGVYEFLWTSEARLDKLQAEAGFTPTLVSETAQPEATVISVRQQPVADAFPSSLTDLESPPTLEHFSGLADRALAGMGPRLPMITIGASAVILIAICYLVVAHLHSGNRSKVAGPTLATASPPVVQPASAQAPSQPSITSGSAPTPPATPSPAPEGAKRPTHTPVADTNDQTQTTTAAVPKQGSRVHECSIAGLIPNYLNLAEGNRIRGQYDAAVRQYNQVLGCEPNNRQAQDGLRRTKDAGRLNGIR